jgi:hypothetical protein
MWPDYIGVVPGIAAAVMGYVTLKSQDMPRWKKRLVFCLMVLAIGATAFTQWWTLHVKQRQDARRTEIVETLGSLIAEGQFIQYSIAATPNGPIPLDEMDNWLKKTQAFLSTLGQSYVARFGSGAGLETSLSPGGLDDTRVKLWRGFRVYLTRLHEFSSEFAGQVPRRSSSDLF